MRKKIFVSVGECMAELQSAESDLYSLKFGGDTLNTAWYARALIDPVLADIEYFTAVGGDQISRKLMTFLEQNCIGTRFITEIKERNIGLYLISLAGGERSFTYWRSASAARLLAGDEKMLRAALSSADIIYFSGITLAILEPRARAVFLHVLADMRGKGAEIAFDSNVRRRLWSSDRSMKSALTAGYRTVTLALPTFEDERMIFGDSSPSDCAKRIADFGVKEVIVKDGPSSAMLLADGKLQPVAPQPAGDIVDTTGAGDSFNGGYLAARLAGLAPGDAARFAHRIAARVIGGRGALLPMETFADLRIMPDNSAIT